MNVFSSSSKLSFRDDEYQRFNVRLFIRKYDLWMIIKEHQFHNRDNTALYSRKVWCDIIIMNGFKLCIKFYKINVKFYFILHVLDLKSELLDKFYQTET
jgi:hypothetical protein